MMAMVCASTQRSVVIIETQRKYLLQGDNLGRDEIKLRLLQTRLNLQDFLRLHYCFHSCPLPLDIALRSKARNERIHDVCESIDGLLAFLQGFVGHGFWPMEFFILLNPCEKCVKETQVFDDSLDLLWGFAD